MRDTLPHLLKSDFPAIKRNTLTTVQANIILTCNQQCFHCHVNSSPKRKEAMSQETIDKLLSLIDHHGAQILDITGGAPELHPLFRYLVKQARERSVQVIDRCNLTILLEPGQEGTTNFLAENQVDIVASLPCYLEDNVNAQRGEGVFTKSIEGLRKLNAVGYGKADSGLTLNLVYNPQGANLPPQQQQLELDYKRILQEEYEVEFNQLFTLCNMPIKRFGSTLLSNNEFVPYMNLLKASHQSANLADLMCRNMLSIDYQGFVYDCDFNQMLELEKKNNANKKLHIDDLLSAKQNSFNEIIVCDHCYGCSAGQGSSCGGALS